MNKEITNHLYNSLAPQHKSNIHKQSFYDIANILLTFHNDYHSSDIRRVCTASMGHGKTTALKAYLKWIIKQDIKIPVLLSVREKHLAHEIYNDIHKEHPSSIVNIDSENKHTFEDDLHKYQIIIVQHQRLKNFAIGYGNIYQYQYYERSKKGWGTYATKEKVKRLLIIDEKPYFYNSSIFDIGSRNNVLDWFDDLAEPLGKLPLTLQKYKSYIVFLLSEQLAENLSDTTTRLISKEDKKTKRATDLLDMLKEMRRHEDNQTKFESLNKLIHFHKLLNKNGYGRIDDYELRGHTGRKIIISNYIDYSKLGMNVLVFDGTARPNGYQYAKGKFKAQNIENRNNYKRLNIQIDCINTTKYSREKTGSTTQKAIAKRIKEIQQKDKDIFILPVKNDIKIYKSEEVIRKSDYKYYEDTDHEKGINLLNTTGKNVLRDKTSLYLTCLPKKNADYYKQIAIALYGKEVNLLTNKETDNGQWFQDEKLDRIYRGELYSELLQIIHRTALRNIKSHDPIKIYIAYDEESNRYDYEGRTIIPISENLKHRFFNNDCNILPQHHIVDISLYGRDKKIKGFAEQIDKVMGLEPIRVSGVSKSFSKYIENHWNTKAHTINQELSVHGYKVFEMKDRYSQTSKYVSLI